MTEPRWKEVGLLRFRVIPEHLMRPHKFDTYNGPRWEQWVYDLPPDWRELAGRDEGIVVEVNPVCVMAYSKRALRHEVRKFKGERP